MVGKYSRIRDAVFWATHVRRTKRIALLISILWGGSRCSLANDLELVGRPSAAKLAEVGETSEQELQKIFLLTANDLDETARPIIPAIPTRRSQNLPGAAGPGQKELSAEETLPAIDVGGAGVQARSSVVGIPIAIGAPDATGKVSQDQESDEESAIWRVPPIRWGGSLGYSFQRTQTSGGASTTSHGFLTSLNAASYIYAPWAATVSGRLGLVTSSFSADNAQSSFLNSVADQSRNKSWLGGAELNVFPSSRFPFQAFIDRSDSRMSGNLVSNDYVNNRFGFRQSYRAADGITHASFQFDRSNVISSLGGNDTLTAISGNYGNEIGIVRNAINGRYSLGEREYNGERAKLIDLNSTHSASLDDNLNITGNINFLDNSLRTGSISEGFGDYQTRFLQLNSFATWMPEFEDREDLPLTLSISARFLTLKSAFSGSSTDSQGMGANINALYRFSTNFTVGSSFAVNQIRSSGQQGILMTQMGVNANYVGSPLVFGNYSYNWNIGGGILRQGSNGSIPSDITTLLQAGHSVSRNFVIDQSQMLMLSVTQSISSNQSQEAERSVSVTHSLAASYGIRWAERFSGTATLSLSDITSSGTNAYRYRMLGAGITGTGQLSPLSSVNANLQLNWSQQRIDTQPNLEFLPNGSLDTRQSAGLLGTVSYTHNRFLGVRRLRYNLLFSADTRMRDDRLLGNINGEIEKTRWTINNRLDYRIALLDFRVNAVLNDTGGKKNALLFFQVTRQIGAY